MKKVLCVLVLICVIIGAAFAQAKPATPAPAPAKPAASSTRANAIGADAYQLVKGFIAKEDGLDVFIIVASYERLLSPHYSIGGELDMYFITIGSGAAKKDAKYFSLAAEGRYYPVSENLEKFFIGTTLGYSQFEYDGSTKRENGGFTGFRTSLKVGYKVITKGGFFMEPSLAYVLQKAASGYSGSGIPLGWNGGLRLGYAF